MAASPNFESAGRPRRSSLTGGLAPEGKGEVSTRSAHEMARYKALIARTVDVFGDEIKASRWLSLPNRDLEGQTPLEVAQKDGYDFKAIEPILIRIEHGVEY